MAQEILEPAKTKKPSDSAFKQQRLPAWQPILTAGTVLPTFFVIGIAFIPVGIGLLYFSDDVKELVIDYTDCIKSDLDSSGNIIYDHDNKTCASIISKNSSDTCNCYIKFNLTQNFEGKVFMYYGLSNYYQNHRRYVKSRDDNQLLGRLDVMPINDCEPFAYVNESNEQKPIAPCGAIANSMFNDVLMLNAWMDGKREEVPLLKRGIAWESDRRIKFKNPEPESDLQTAFKGFAKPKAWKKNIWELDTADPDNNGFLNEDFIVWMRTAALPTFRKLYRRVNHDKMLFVNGLIQGDYELKVEYNYDVSPFDGSKRMILSTTSLLGGKNPFLGIAYIVVGCVCVILGIVLLFVHIKCGKSTSEMINVNPRTPYQ